MDGAGAHYAAYKKFGDKATYIEVQYNEPFPDFEYKTEDEIYILDFCYDRATLLKMSEICKIVVIDHHDTAMKDMEGLDFCIFDMEKSGAVLAWEYFHPNIEVPYFLKLLQDYDLWNWKHSETLDLTSRFQSDIQRLNPSYMDDLVSSCESYYLRNYYPFSADENQLTHSSKLFYNYMELGGEAASAMKKEMDTLINKKKYVVKDIDGKKVAIFNTTVYFSMMGHTVLGLDFVDYSMSYFIKEDGAVVFSFRSRKNGHDVGAVARKLGGGGHKSASGAVVPFPRSFEVLRDIYELESVQ